MLDPLVKHKVDNEKFIVHVAGGYSEDQKFVVEDIRSALFAEDVSVYFKLLVFEADLEMEVLVVEGKVVG